MDGSGPECILTVAVCTYRRFDRLGDCLESLDSQTLEKSRYRILVVDNSLLEESRSFRDSLGHMENLEYIITEKSGLSYARNVALGKCNTPYIAYIDDDAIASPGWAEAIISAFENSKCSVGVVGGPVEPVWEENCPGWLKGRLLHPFAVVDWGTRQKVVNGFSEWFVAANVAYRTDILKRVKGFPRHLGRKGELLLCHEELWVHRRFRDLGYLLSFSPDVKVRHLVQKQRMSVAWLCLDAFWEGFSRRIVDYGIEDISDIDQVEIAEIKNEIAMLADNNQFEEKTEEIIKATQIFNERGRKIIDRQYADFRDRHLAENQRHVFIVTPSMNAGECIDRAISSVVSQQGDFFLHYHIQDGNSSDGTIQRLKKWKNLLESREYPIFCNQVSFSWASEPDQGMYDAICKAFSLFEIPKQSVMTWINTDDYLYQGAVANAVELFDQEKGVDWITGATDVHDKTGKKIGFYTDGYPRRIIRGGLCDTQNWRAIQQEGTFWRKRLWDRADGLDRRFKMAGDWDLWRRFASHSELHIFSWPAGSFQFHKGQMSGEEGAYIKEISKTISADARRQRFEELIQDPGNLEYLNVYPDYLSKAYKIRKKTVRYMPESDCEETSIKSDIPGCDFQENGKIATGMRHSNSNSSDETAFCPVTGNRPGHTFAEFISRLPGWIRCWFVIQHSRLFFNTYYLQQYPDVVGSRYSPLMHYIFFGAAEGRNPNPVFDTRWYLENSPDVKKSGINPLYHYIKYGWKEGRDPGSGFSTKDYLDKYPDVYMAGVNPVKHYLLHGLIEGRSLPNTQK